MASSSVTIFQEPPRNAQPKSSIVDDFMYGSNVAQAHLYVRLGFMRKVYGILSVQLLLTTFIAGGMMFYGGDALKLFLHKNVFVMFILFIATIINMFALSIKRLDYPSNFVLLFSFTILESIMIGCVVVHYSVALVIQAFFLTAVVTGALSLYAMQTKRDLTHWGGALGAALLILFCASLLQLFFHIQFLHLVISIGGAILFSLFIIFDTWMIMHRVSPEEYVIACIDLYLDIINLFLYLLRILNEINKE